MFYKFLLVTIALAPCVLGQDQQTGTCALAGMAGFQLTPYLGVWHQIERVNNTNELGACSTSAFTQDTTVVTVNNTEVVDGILSFTAGTATAATDNTGYLTVVFPSTAGGTAAGTTANYYVVATDYTDYALVMSCVDVTATTRAVYGWKLARAKTGFAATTAVAAINTAVAANTYLATVPWILTDQSAAACEVTSSAALLSGAITWASLMAVFVAFYK